MAVPQTPVGKSLVMGLSLLVNCYLEIKFQKKFLHFNHIKIKIKSGQYLAGTGTTFVKAAELAETRPGFPVVHCSPHKIINNYLLSCLTFFQVEITAIREVRTTLQHDRSKSFADSLFTLQALPSKLTRS